MSKGKPEISEKTLRRITMLEDWDEQREALRVLLEQIGCGLFEAE